MIFEHQAEFKIITAIKSSKSWSNILQHESWAQHVITLITEA